MHRKSAVALNHLFVSGELSAVEIIDHFLKRIERHDPSLGAFLTRFDERARAQAKALDQKRSRKEPLGKMAAVPIALKDNIHVEGELTTCASKFLTNYRAPFSATVTRLLTEADGIIIGKANLDEFAMGSSNEHSALQETRNPWNLNLSPGGSSGGSTVAVAARMAPLALGSDTGGSVRLPASFCGIFGYKPTYGRISRYGLVAFGSSLDQIGPLAAHPEDIALAMEVLGQPCAHDSTSLNAPGERYLDRIVRPIESVTIGVPWNLLQDGLDPEVEANFRSSIAQWQAMGAKIEEIDLPTVNYSIAIYYILASAEASTNLSRFDGVRYGVRSPKAETLDQVYDLSREAGFGAEVKRRILLGTYVLSSGYKDAFYRKAQKVRTVMIDEFRTAFDRVDLVAMPTAGAPAFGHKAKRDPLSEYLTDLYTISANLAGLPAISIPSGFSKDGRPLSLQLVGPQQADVELCRAAYAFAQQNPAFKEIPSGVKE